MTKISINKSKFDAMINEAIQQKINEAVEEGFWGGMKNVFQRGKNDVSNAYNNYQQNRAQGQGFGDSIKNATNGMFTQQNFNRYKSGYTGASKLEDLQQLNQLVDKLAQNGTLNPKVVSRIKMLVGQSMGTRAQQAKI